MTKRENRLAREKSPYLRQHAANPVDWYPWGEEALSKAKAEDKPIFLSIGYSTCHWCHVMERESFENEEVARLMNDAFVCIKVDREERPDVDSIYMTTCMMMTGRGGWPLTVLMTPDMRPFFAATYIPRESRPGMTGMLDLVPSVKSIWSERRAEVLQSAMQVSEALQKLRPSSGGMPDAKTLAEAYKQLSGIYDQARGGFGQSPKFPSPHTLLFLMRMHARTGDQQPLAMASSTLHAMRRGGIFDHLGLGFHRYSTDAAWLLPHFEKMLYDQAGLALAYGEAYQITGDPLFRQAAEEIHDYVSTDLMHPDRAFFCAEDADSEGEEGKFYVWTMAEVREVLGDADAELAAKIFGLAKEGNFADEATGELTGANVLHLKKPVSSIASDLKMTPEEFEAAFSRIRQRLLAAREKRERPMRDDKVLADWNGYYIAALAANARAFGRSDLTTRARHAADFVLANMRAEDGGLLHSYMDGEAAIPGFLDDYAYIVWGLTELYQACLEPLYLTAALDLAERMLVLFSDSERGGFYLTSKDGEELIHRPKEGSDGAMPSGNSTAAFALAKLGRLTGRSELEDMAQRTLMAFSKDMDRGPANYCMMLCALDFLLGPTSEVAVAGDKNAADTRALVDAVNRAYLPRAVLLLAGKDMAGIAPFTAQMQPGEGGAAQAFVCENFACQAPVSEPEGLLEILNEKPD